MHLAKLDTFDHFLHISLAIYASDGFYWLAISFFTVDEILEPFENALNRGIYAELAVPINLPDNASG